MLSHDITHIEYSEKHIAFVKLVIRLMLIFAAFFCIITLCLPGINIAAKLKMLIWPILMLLYCRIFNIILKINCPIILNDKSILIYNNPLAQKRIIDWQDVEEITIKKTIIKMKLKNGKTFKFTAKGLSLSPDKLYNLMQSYIK